MSHETTKSYPTSRGASSVSVEFVFPLLCGGHLAAEMECRARASVRLGRPAVYHPWPGEPAEGDDVENYRDIEVDCGGYDRATKRHVPNWQKPDDYLAARIVAYLNDGNENGTFVEAARNEPRDDPDYRRDLAQDFDHQRVVDDPAYRSAVKNALNAKEGE